MVRHPPNISDVSLPLSLAHTHTHTHTPTHYPAHRHKQTLTDTPTQQATRTGTHTHTHTTYVHTGPHSQSGTRPYRHSPTHTPCYWDSTGSYPGRGVHYQIQDRLGVRIIILGWRVQVILNTCCTKEFGQGW